MTFFTRTGIAVAASLNIACLPVVEGAKTVTVRDPYDYRDTHFRQEGAIQAQLSEGILVKVIKPTNPSDGSAHYGNGHSARLYREATVKGKQGWYVEWEARSDWMVDFYTTSELRQQSYVHSSIFQAGDTGINSHHIIAVILKDGAVVDFAAHDAIYDSVEKLCSDKSDVELPEDLQYDNGAPRTSQKLRADGKQCSGARFIVADIQTKLEPQTDSVTGQTEQVRKYAADITKDRAQVTISKSNEQELRWDLIAHAQQGEIDAYARSTFVNVQRLVPKCGMEDVPISRITKALANGVKRGLRKKQKEKFGILKELEAGYEKELKYLVEEHTGVAGGVDLSEKGSFEKVRRLRESKDNGILFKERAFQQKVDANAAIVKNYKTQLTTLEQVRWKLRTERSFGRGNPWARWRAFRQGQKEIYKSKSMTLKQVFSETDDTQHSGNSKDVFEEMISESLKSQMLIHKKSFMQIEKSLETHKYNLAQADDESNVAKFKQLQTLKGNGKYKMLAAIVVTLGAALGIFIYAHGGWAVHLLWNLLYILAPVTLGLKAGRAWFKAKTDASTTFREELNLHPNLWKDNQTKVIAEGLQVASAKLGDQ